MVRLGFISALSVPELTGYLRQKRASWIRKNGIGSNNRYGLGIPFHQVNLGRKYGRHV